MQLTSPARTALAFALAAVFAWLFFLIWRRDRAQPALAWWGATHVAWAAAMLLLGLRDAIPPAVSIVLGNIALGLGYGLLWGGARLFSGLGLHWRGILAGAVVWVLGCLTPGFFESLPVRVALSSSTIAVYSFVVALVFRAGMRRQRLPSHRAAIGMLIAHGIVHGIRATGAIFLDFETSGVGPPEAGWNAVVAILAITLLSSFAMLLVALAGERSALASNAVLAAARDAEAQVSQEKSRFLARMSHELRTPLNGVLGMAQALARDPSLSAEQRERAATLEHAGRHLLAIVNDVLDLTRIEAGRLEFSPRPVRLRERLAEALDLVRAAATEKRMVLRLELAPELPEAVLADPVRLRQILLNLLSNAVKFTPEGGEVTLQAVRTPEGGLRLTVTDTGPGVPPELRDTLFGEFMQGRRASAAGEGTGLGLAICTALARAMGGAMQYAPGPGGRGSAFSATLPLPAARLEADEAPAAVPSAAPERPLRLLVVDDIRPNRMVARALLEQEGHVVTEAADGASAVEALRRGPPPDAVLMDVGMPDMDGYAATVLIRGLQGVAGRVPVIALTAYAMPEDIAASLAAGMDGHLAKPLERTALLAELARVVPGR